MELAQWLYFILNLGSIIILLLLLFALRAYRKVNTVRAVRNFGFVLLGWLIIAALELFLNQNQPLLVRNLNRLSESFFLMLPLAIIHLVDVFASQKKILTRKSYIFLGLLTLFLLSLLWTNQYHLFYWKQERLINSTSGYWILVQETSLTTIAATIFEVILLFSLFHFLHLVIQMGEYYKNMARFAVFAITIAALATALNLVKPFGLAFDYLPIALTIALFSISRFITRYQIFDLVPISRISYFNSIGDGAIVVDRERRILDVNDSVQTLFHGPKHDDVIGMVITTLFPEWNDVLDEVIDNQRPATITHRTRHQEEDLQYDVSFQPFTNAGGMVTSVLVKFQNVTFYTQLLAQLHELAIRDPLTGVLNRRHFELLVRDHLKLAHRYQRNCSMVMFDLNNFKNLNDIHGHPLGDAALSLFSRLIHKELRESDIFARFGGDEFILFLPETDLSGALIVLENLWEILEGKSYAIDGYMIHLQTCAGISYALPDGSYDFDELVYQADRSLYASKEQCPCTVGVWKDGETVCLNFDALHQLSKVW